MVKYAVLSKDMAITVHICEFIIHNQHNSVATFIDIHKKIANTFFFTH